MTVTGHLSELRKRITAAAVAFLAASVVCFIFIEKFVNLLLRLGTSFDFVYLSPSELLTCYMKLALILGLVIASPVILWQIWAFIRPGLTETETRSTRGAILGGFGCFLLGAAFCYVVILPITLNFLYDFNTSTDITANISFNNYMSFITGMLLAFGVVFEMPVLSYLLGRFGLLNPTILRKGRKFAVLIIFILAAIITPPDVVSQLMTGIPMLGLYEVSIWVCSRAYKRHEADPVEDEDEAEGDEEE